MEVKTGYKHTEIGKFPHDWDLANFPDFVWFQEGPGLRKWQFRTKGLKVINVTNLTDKGYLDLESTDRHISWEEFEKTYKHFLIDAEDIVVASSGNSYCKTAVVRAQDLPLLMNTSVIRFKPKRGLADKYLLVFLKSPYFKKQIDLMITGGAQPNFGPAHLKKVLLPIPQAESEQQNIANALSDADALIESLEQLIEKKRQIKQGVMQELLTGKRRLPGFSGEWETTQVCNVVAGYFCGPSPTCEERNINGNEWGVLKTTAATKEYGWDWTMHKVLPKVFWNKPELELKKGDVIVTKAGPRHRVGVAVWVDFVPPRIIVSGKMIGLRPQADKIIGIILAASISSCETQAYLNQRTTGMAESQVNYENTVLLEAPIRIPQIGEQQAISEVMAGMEAELLVLEQQLDKACTVKQAMMQNLLTGKVRLI